MEEELEDVDEDDEIEGLWKANAVNERVDKSRSKLTKWRRLAEGEKKIKKGKEIEKAPKKNQ